MGMTEFAYCFGKTARIVLRLEMDDSWVAEIAVNWAKLFLPHLQDRPVTQLFKQSISLFARPNANG